MTRTSAPTTYQVLDPHTLGRPIHALREFTTQFRDDLAEAFRAGLNRRYRAQFQVGEVTITPAISRLPAAQWQLHACEVGRIGFAIDRRLLLSVLAYRYGLGQNMVFAASSTPDSLPAETATEDRLRAALGRQFIQLLADRLEAGHRGEGDEPATVAHEFKTINQAPVARGAWVVTAQIEETAHAMTGSLMFTLDEAWMDRLLHNNAPRREKVSDGPTSAAPLPTRLQLILVARLLQKEMQLGELLNIKVGDVIPISLSDADVLIDDSRLFTATVAEHKGKLCLTAFSDIE